MRNWNSFGSFLFVYAITGIRTRKDGWQNWLEGSVLKPNLYTNSAHINDNELNFSMPTIITAVWPHMIYLDV